MSDTSTRCFLLFTLLACARFSGAATSEITRGEVLQIRLTSRVCTHTETAKTGANQLFRLQTGKDIA